MFDEIPKLDQKGLREFGLLTGTIIALLLGLVLPLLWGHSLPLIPWIIGGVLIILAIFIPKSLDPIHYGWMKVAQVLGFVNSRIILGIIFFIVVTPMGLIMRLNNRDPMTRKFEFSLETYRVSSQIKSKVSMEKPY
ncbi:SxtJ family membrane protein [Crocosphaera sp. UHCC 0190]|uniref:SxtJ family membrane protein n=1 Tax=Crocosphaera sp. UHCC 0190 TaxID=3110246 RepID=UPI002B20ABDD|nr:SxtJ family membrane protein [Crocosphaera sp. UHCC 0190]MEA5508786.1 SxtJ family membrane protein [Crocosphaera sp. UHCC 0190]